MSHHRNIPFLWRLHEKRIFAKAIPELSQIMFRRVRGMNTYLERLERLEQTNRRSSEQSLPDSCVCSIVIDNGTI